ncbi:Aste57867_10752 [Aphanomyces stellatus]|uniref:Aste57867_10752 protein n=1 Tax=Aphanomyces stellatus TaxID=120398 RepID=A0A485KR69_9STRA|nr:hypothetical protein As57867_010712 [Aphanomyces stellatus]VFT87622.1 Aste57867_10752 [Aphanomyces stellatus]
MAPPPTDAASSLQASRKSMMLMGVNDAEMTAILKKVEAHKEFSAASEVKDMIQYLMFLALFIVVTVDVSGSYKPDSPYLVTAMLNAQLREKPFLYADVRVKKTFEDIKTVLELHQYLTGPFYESVFGGASFDGDESYPVGDRFALRGFVGGTGRILGPIRIGQIRVKAEVCGGVMASVPGLFPNNSIKCFDEYSASTESTETFGYHYNYTALAPKPAEPSFHSYTHRWYGPPSFAVMVPSRESATCEPESKEHCDVYELLASLKEHKYFDKATRAVFVDFNLYTPNIDHTTTVRLFAEQLPGGGLATQVEFLTYRLYAWHDTADYIQLGCEGLIYFIIFVQLAGELAAARRRGWRYFSYVGNVAVQLNYLFFLIVLGLRLMSKFKLPSVLTDTEYMDFRTPTFYFSLARSCQSFNCFLSWLKLFKFLAFIPVFGQLTRTVERAAGKVMELVLIFVLALVGIALAFLLAFGNYDSNYHTFVTSLYVVLLLVAVSRRCRSYTLLHIVTGEMSLTDLRLANRVLGPFFFIVFVFLMMFIILNIFIVIVSDSYTVTKKEIKLEKQMALDTLSKEIVKHFLEDFVFKVPFLGPRLLKPLIERTTKALHQANQNVGTITRKIRSSTGSVPSMPPIIVKEAPHATATTQPAHVKRCYDTLHLVKANRIPSFLQHMKAAPDVHAAAVWLEQFHAFKARTAGTIHAAT